MHTDAYMPYFAYSGRGQDYIKQRNWHRTDGDTVDNTEKSF